MPVKKSNIKYGCERCSSNDPSQGEFFTELTQVGRFRHMENNKLVEFFMCSQCKVVYIKMDDEFIPGFFQDESAMLGSSFQ